MLPVVAEAEEVVDVTMNYFGFNRRTPIDINGQLRKTYILIVYCDATERAMAEYAWHVRVDISYYYVFVIYYILDVYN